MLGIPERCDACDAVIGDSRACPHCNCITPNAEERAGDRIRIAFVFVLAVLLVIR